MGKDNYIPDGAWQFNADVAEVFEDMITRSIPDYDNMRDLTARLVARFKGVGTSVIDLGCSTGMALEDIIKTSDPHTHYYLCDTSEPMLAVCRKKYEGNGHVSVVKHDIRNGMPARNCTVILSCLTLQFVPIEYRQQIIADIYDSLLSGGVFLMVEKVLGYSSPIDHAMQEEYYAIKRENSYTEEQIAEKRKSLEGTLVPVTEATNRQFLAAAGFELVDCYWRYLNFCGLIAIKRKL